MDTVLTLLIFAVAAVVASLYVVQWVRRKKLVWPWAVAISIAWLPVPCFVLYVLVLSLMALGIIAGPD